MLLAGGVGVGLVAVGGAAAYVVAPNAVRTRIDPPEIFVPKAPEGVVRLERITSERRGRAVDLFTAVPAGHGDGAGLPVGAVR